MRDEVQEYGLEPEGQDRPRVVEEAYEVLGSYQVQLAVTGALAIGAWTALLATGTVLPLPWLLLVLGALLVLFFAPVTREPRLARDVLRRWDALRVERALGSSGISSDPRLEVAESMADRILRHPASDERIRSVTEALVRRLRRLLDDLSRTRYLGRAHTTGDRDDLGRSMSDLQDILDARVADVLGQLAQLHRTVVLRDTASLERVVSAVETMVRELEAEREVERLLSNAENG
jgi:hypothetical protein